MLSSDDQVLTSHDNKVAVLCDFYNGLLGSHMHRDRTINLDELDIPSHDLATMNAPFSEDDVWKTICQLPLDKAPGSDGFTGRFYRVL